MQYQDYQSAMDLGIIGNKGTEMFIGVDHGTAFDRAEKGRRSVRLESKDTYNGGLIVADFSHMPKPACGAWPSL